jgi:hypothetical protein
VDINRYAYAGNDPINKSDPNGHVVPLIAAGCVAGGCEAAIAATVVALELSGLIVVGAISAAIIIDSQADVSKQH